MKKISILILITIAFIAGRSEASSIGRLVKKLKPYVYSVHLVGVDGKNANQMLTDLASRVHRLADDEFEITHYPKVLPGADEGGNTYGLVKISGAVSLIVDQNERLSKEERNRVWQIFRQLRKAGAKFAYTSNGPGVCGVTFPAPLILDVEEGEIHDISPIGGPC